jgi:hypothetical protein
MQLDERDVEYGNGVARFLKNNFAGTAIRSAPVRASGTCTGNDHLRQVSYKSNARLTSQGVVLGPAIPVSGRSFV